MGVEEGMSGLYLTHFGVMFRKEGAWNGGCLDLTKIEMDKNE